MKWAEVSEQKENTWYKWAVWLGGTKSFAMRVVEGLEVMSHGQVSHGAWKNGQQYW